MSFNVFTFNDIYVVSRLFFRMRGPALPSGKVCLTRNPGVLVSSRTGSAGFFVGEGGGGSLGKTLQNPRLFLVKPRKYINNVRCLLEITEILLKAA